MSLQEIIQKSKSDEVFIFTLILLIGIGSFGLGRLSKVSQNRQSLTILAPRTAISSLEAENASETAELRALSVDEPNAGGQVLGSKSGSKYHYPWCSGAKTIAEKNKVWFNSASAARAAGYTPAANCKGLE